MYLEQIEQLVVLQKVDDEIIVLEKELESLPQEVAELEKKNEEFEARLAQFDDKIDILESQRSRLNTEIEDNTGKIKKSKSKLMMAENSREYQAMMREMDNMEKMNRTREEEQVALAEELDRQQEARKEVADEADELRKELEERQASLKKRTTSAKRRLTELGKQRDKACAVVPSPVLGRYEFIRSRIHNPVIVPVDDGVCLGCNVRIPPQSYNDLQKGEQILSCPNCQRLIYWTNHFQDPALAAKGKASKTK